MRAPFHNLMNIRPIQLLSKQSC